MKVLDWNPGNDKTLKPKEVEIHDQYHKNLANSGQLSKKSIFGGHRQFRIRALETALRRANTKISGRVLEVGAGDGWCSAYMHNNFQVGHIYTMEINRSATEVLIPKVFEVTGVDTTKTTIVLGSFNNIELKNHFDFVVAMGAIHHSENLYQTFKNIYDALKPGGWFIAQEPYMHNGTLNSFYFERENQEVNFKKIRKLKNKDRSDLFYRECEYRTAGFHVGFDYYDETIFKEPQSRLARLLGKRQRESHNKPNDLIIYAQKSQKFMDEKSPTSWEV